MPPPEGILTEASHRAPTACVSLAAPDVRFAQRVRCFMEEFFGIFVFALLCYGVYCLFRKILATLAAARQRRSE